jgi:hypothetical protein
LFKTPEVEVEDDYEIDEDEEDNGLDKKWLWFGIIERLANGDITKFNEIYKQNYIAALNLLSYWKEKQNYIEKNKK